MAILKHLLCVAILVLLGVPASGLVIATPASATGSWSAPIMTPGGAKYLSAVSCASPNFCVAVTTDNRALIYNGTSWTAPAVVDPVTAFQSDGVIYAVSCPTSTFCAAATAGGSTPIYDGSSWSIGLPGHGVGAGLYSVSCPSDSFCIAVGNTMPGPGKQAVAYVGGSGGFSSVNTYATSAASLTAVSCASSGFCVALARYQAWASSYAGGEWSFYGPLDPAAGEDFVAGPSHALSCPSSTFCAMVDYVGNAATFDGATWTTAAGIDGGTRLTSVSCPTSTFCVAVDGNGNALTYNGTAWSAPTKIDGSNVLTSVSCPTSQFCMAVDGAGNAVTWRAVAAPANVTRPAISGTARVGSTLTCSNGTWTSSPTSYRRQWYRNGTAISGATSITHPVVGADLQRRLTCAVTATNSGGSSAPAMSGAVTVKATTALTLRETSRSGSVRSCGASAGTACRDARGASVYFAGKATPVPIPAATRKVTVSYYHRSNGAWHLKVTRTVTASSLTGAWRTTQTGVTSLTGAWRARATAAATATLTSAASAYRYYVVH
jgi:hypothetical protein